jgi:hypothetical protein
MDKYQPDACPAHAGSPPPCRLDIIFDLEMALNQAAEVIK